MNIKPLGMRVVIKAKEVVEKTSGGIYLPDSAKEKTNEGVVEAVGTNENISVKVGDRVLFESYGGTEITLSGQKYLIMDEKDIIAIFK